MDKCNYLFNLNDNLSSSCYEESLSIRRRISPSQSWIEDNIQSIIQNNDDTLNDSIQYIDASASKYSNTKVDESFVEVPRELMETPCNSLFKANPLKRSGSPVHFPKTFIPTMFNLFNNDFNEWKRDSNNLNESPNRVEDLGTVPSPPFKNLDDQSGEGDHQLLAQNNFQSTESYHQQQQNFNSSFFQHQQKHTKSNFLNVLKTLDQEFNDNNVKTIESQNKILKSSSTLFKENNKTFVSHSFSSDNVNIVKNNSNLYQHHQDIDPKVRRAQGYVDTRIVDTEQKQQQKHQNLAVSKDHIVLHVKNLDYKISADEWRRILTENFKKHCKDVIDVSIITHADKSFLGIVKLGNKDDVRLAISSLHHKKIGYKRLNVAVAFSPQSDSPKSKVVSLLRSTETQEMALTRFLEMFESRYNQQITIAELFKLRDVIHIVHSKDGQGRLIKLLTKTQSHNLFNEMKDLMHTPYCVLHSQKYLNSNKSAPSVCWLPNVIVSLRTFKPLVHKLLNDHGGQMPLLSFLDCYRACILNEPASGAQNSTKSQFNSNQQLIIDNENGLPLEHLATCAQDVIISLNEGVYKQLQWDNDKSKQTLTTRHKTYFERTIFSSGGASGTEQDCTTSEFDESIEESQRKQNQFSHEVVELFKSIPRCIVPMSKFSTEYNKKYGRQCRVADYGYTKLYDLIESIPHVLQILGSEYDKKLTLTHRVQVRRFSNDLTKVLKAHTLKQMFADEYPVAYEKHFGRQFDIKDYGVCYLEDMLAELPESTVSRKEIDNRTFIQIPKVIQLEEEKLCTKRLRVEVIDMLRHKPRFSIQFSKFIPNFHHHFGRQLKLSNYGFTKLVDLLEAMPDVVQFFIRDDVQFVQLKEDIMLDLICKNILSISEMNNNEINCENIFAFESAYNSIINDPICYQDFGCNQFLDLLKMLPLSKFFINFEIFNNHQLRIKCEKIEQKEADRLARVCLKRMFEDKDEALFNFVQVNRNLNKSVCFDDFFNINVNLLALSKSDLILISNFNKRTKSYFIKLLIEFFNVEEQQQDDQQTLKDDGKIMLTGLSDLYMFSKQLRTCFISANCFEMSTSDLELLYRQHYSSCKVVFSPKKLGFIDLGLLIAQGLGLIFVSKKHIENRTVFLKKEFWPQYLNNSFVVSTPQSSPQSILQANHQQQQQFTPISYFNYNHKNY